MTPPKGDDEPLCGGATALVVVRETLARAKERTPGRGARRTRTATAEVNLGRPPRGARAGATACSPRLARSTFFEKRTRHGGKASADDGTPSSPSTSEEQGRASEGQRGLIALLVCRTLRPLPHAKERTSTLRRERAQPGIAHSAPPSRRMNARRSHRSGAALARTRPALLGGCPCPSSSGARASHFVACAPREHRDAQCRSLAGSVPSRGGGGPARARARIKGRPQHGEQLPQRARGSLAVSR